jgi:CSLREA domain-containing protein
MGVQTGDATGVVTALGRSWGGRRRWLRAVALLGAFTAMAAITVACHPPLTLIVTTTVDGHDADPGDGVCEMTPQAGDCSLRAAIEEGNAQAALDAYITVPTGSYPVGSNTDGPLDVRPASGTMWIQGENAVVASSGIAGPAFNVATGILNLTGLTISANSLGPDPGNPSNATAVFVRAGATATLSNDALINSLFGLRIENGADAVSMNTDISANFAGVVNGGSFTAIFTTVTANSVEGIDTSATGATTTLWASVVGAQTFSVEISGLNVDCHGPALSLGYNLDSDGTCGLTKPTDHPDLAPHLETPSGTAAAYPPAVGSPLIDAIPSGTPPCVTDLDQLLHVRPVGAGCDIGSVERQ